MTEKPHYHGHIDRLRERFIKTGITSLQDYEILELLISYAIRGKDVKPAAKRLIDRFGTLQGVMNADIDALCEVKGIGRRSAGFIRFVREIIFSYLAEEMTGDDYLESPESVVKFCRSRLAGLKNETFMAIFLDVKNKVLGYEILQEGTIDKTVLFPRKLVEYALAKNASGIILVHNHTSGDIQPSSHDQSLTREIAAALKPLDIRLLDHLIVGASGHFSLMDNIFT